MKKQYQSAELEIILFHCDVIVTSGQGEIGDSITEPDNLIDF